MASTPAEKAAGYSILAQPDGGVYFNLSQCALRPNDPKHEQQKPSRRIVPREAVNMTTRDAHHISNWKKTSKKIIKQYTKMDRCLCNPRLLSFY